MGQQYTCGMDLFGIDPGIGVLKGCYTQNGVELAGEGHLILVMEIMGAYTKHGVLVAINGLSLYFQNPGTSFLF